MKNPIPAPELLSLDGDAEEEVVQTFSPPAVVNTGARSVAERMKALVRRGLSLRAVVIHMQDFDGVGRRCNPLNWGIVIDVNPMSTHPLQVAWTDGRRQWSDGSELKVVYTGCPESSMNVWIEGVNSARQ